MLGVVAGRSGQGAQVGCLSDDAVTEMVAGALDPEAFAAAEGHLDICRRCRLWVSTLAAKTGDRLRDGSLSAFGPGDTVAGRYRVVALLGAGGMGEVYETLDTVLGETVALKTLAAGIALDELGVTGLKSEVQAARRVTHRNVCRVFDVGFHTDVPQSGSQAADVAFPFFTMELLRGETLRMRLQRRGPLTYAEALPFLEQMAAGLDAAHAAGIVHRDFKSENVMLVSEDSDTRVVITDFGLAHQRREPTPIAMRVAGTLAYMAPEQVAGKAALPATDVYALGVVLFELLTGELPFRPAEIVAGRGQGQRAPLPSLPLFRAIPRLWRNAIERCLEAAPEARFRSAGELLAVLRAPPAPARRRRRLPGLAVGGAMTALIVATFFATATRRPPPLDVSQRGSDPIASPAPRAAWPPPSETKLRSPIPAVAPAPSSAPSPASVRLSPPSSASRPRHARRAAVAHVSVTKPLVGDAEKGPIGRDDFIDPFETR